MPETFHVIILAAGSGQRFGNDTPKQYCALAGKSVLYHSVYTFLSHEKLGSIQVIYDPLHQKYYDDAMKELDLPAPIAGGKSRKESVFNGLKSLHDIKDDEYILIHDGARPMVSRAEIDAVLGALDTAKAASTATPASDTLYHSDGHYVNRENVHRLLTPQGFHYGAIMRAHEQDLDVTDDTALVKALGIDIALVSGSPQNIKITTQDDLQMAEALLARNNFALIRTGIGFDVHAFEGAGTDRPLMLCGVHVQHDRALAGHSDADVGLHALTDALLGALGLGDIGDHFPPSDDQFKNMDSAIFLQKTMDLLAQHSATIENLDLTLICENPKIGPYKEAMKTRVAQICGLMPDQVNIKATTTENLGFTGRGEGIAAQAIATIKVQK